MSTQIKEQSKTASKTKYEHTEKIANRRKALFPTAATSDADSDLGHMSPLHSENSNFSDTALNAIESEVDVKFRNFFKCNLDDYILLERATSPTKFIPDPGSESTMSSLYLSPMQTLISTPILYSPMHASKVTPVGKSPSSTLKTPHDTSTVKLNQKQHAKRKLPVDAFQEAPQAKLPKHDPKSKVRTALFPDAEFVLPAKSFYPKEVDARPFKARFTVCDVRSKIVVASAAQPQRCFPLAVRRNTTRRRFGEINAGVRHNIKKPKQKLNNKKVARGKIAQATLQIIEKSPLTEYLEEMTNVQKTIKPIAAPPVAAKQTTHAHNKENSQQDGVKTRKFFKTLRSTSHKDKAEPENEATSEAKSCLSNDIDAIIGRLDDGTPSRPLAHEMIFSPTTQMCDMASALDLNSPKRAKLNITKMLDDGSYTKRKSPSADERMQKTKLFPLFYAKNNAAQTVGGTTQGTRSAQLGPGQGHKKMKPTADDQMLLDAGQKHFGATECHECNFVYHAGDANDEIIHQQYHDANNTFKFNGWKNERVVTTVGHETRIIKIIPGDSKLWWKRVNEVLDFINRQLGFYDGLLPIEKSQVYLYIKNKKIVGCLIAELKQTAYKLLSTELDIDLLSEEPYQIRCGISRIWVAPHQRRAGIATQLMNTLRRNFLHGYILKVDEIALSTPTDLGKQFAEKFFGSANFLIYIA